MKRRIKMMIVEDEHGETILHGPASEIARFLMVSKPAVYVGAKYALKVRGFKVYAEEVSGQA